MPNPPGPLQKTFPPVTITTGIVIEETPPAKNWPVFALVIVIDTTGGQQLPTELLLELLEGLELDELLDPQHGQFEYVVVSPGLGISNTLALSRTSRTSHQNCN